MTTTKPSRDELAVEVMNVRRRVHITELSEAFAIVDALLARLAGFSQANSSNELIGGALMTVSDEMLERGMRALHEVSTYRGYTKEALDRKYARMEGIYRAHVKAILTAALSDQAVVPREPIEQQINAALDLNATDPFESAVGPDGYFARVYRAMIAAAPPASPVGETKQMATALTLQDFVRESNRIEGIHREPTWMEVDATSAFLLLPRIAIGDLERLVSVYAPGNILRNRADLNVRVGRYVAPQGGSGILEALSGLLTKIHEGGISAYHAHVEYEAIHPFTDGNGRSGRALWLWMMGSAPIGFLHQFYYQTLENSRPGTFAHNLSNPSPSMTEATG